MALDGTWTFSDNQTPIDVTSMTALYRSFMIQFKEFLINTAGWTAVSFSNSTAIAASDNWGTTLTNVVSVNGGGVKSWAVLLSPVGFVAGADGSYLGSQSQIYLVLCCNSGTTAYTGLSCTLHKVAPTGGTTSAAPTSVLQVGYNETSTQTIFDGNNRVSKFHFRAITTGAGSPAKGKGQFEAFISNTTANGMTTMIATPPMWAVQATPTLNYAYEVGIKCVYSTGGFSGLNLQTIFNDIQGWNNSGTTNTTGLDGYYLANLSSTTFLGANVTGLGDIAGRLPSSDIFVYNSTSGSCFPIGKITDHAVTGATPANFTACESGTIYHNTILCSNGSLIVPINNTTFVAG